MLFTQYQSLVLMALALWLLPLLLVWVRFDEFPHAREMILAVLFTPTLLVDDYLLAFNISQDWYFLAGLFFCMPVVLSALLSLAVARLVLDKSRYKPWIIWAPALLMLGLELPFLLAPLAYKVILLQSAPVGQIKEHWPLYAYMALLHFFVLVLAFGVERRISDYQHHLSDQVVDTHFYRFSVAIRSFGGLITLAFLALIVTLLVAFNLLSFTEWRSFISFCYYLMFVLLTLVLMDKRRYSPCPLDYKILASHTFSDAYLQEVLSQAEKAMIKHKAYKHIGLRIREFARVAEVNPNALAIATRKLLNRNFRAFVYHYRLEYAKNVLMRSDARVSDVARRLGFDSEKFLSGVFVKYIQQMGREDKGKDESTLL